ncbi:MAG: pyridoxamine 5'-phosphate oxidase family protein [Bacteroidetes bacterium]|nr:pyridoxamine 5'-phosphate oxidase family protein [Bacteroidota bacterium]
MHEKIIEFIKTQTCASICCADHTNRLHCFTCFYAVDIDEGLLYFKSSSNSTHVTILENNPKVAGTILPDKLNKTKIKGVQFWGEVSWHPQQKTKVASVSYHKKFPSAVMIPGDVFAISITEIKMTDNSFGFAKKVSWKRTQQEQQ